jgi:hypothetical protein
VKEWTSSRPPGRRTSEAVAHVLRLARERGLKLSRGTLYNWSRAYRDAGLWGLIDRRWIVGELAKQWRRHLAPFLAEVARLYESPGLRSIEHCHDLALEWAKERVLPSATLRESAQHIRQHVLPRLTKERGL